MRGGARKDPKQCVESHPWYCEEEDGNGYMKFKCVEKKDHCNVKAKAGLKILQTKSNQTFVKSLKLRTEEKLRKAQEEANRRLREAQEEAERQRLENERRLEEAARRAEEARRAAEQADRARAEEARRLAEEDRARREREAAERDAERAERENVAAAERRRLEEEAAARRRAEELAARNAAEAEARRREREAYQVDAERALEQALAAGVEREMNLQALRDEIRELKRATKERIEGLVREELARLAEEGDVDYANILIDVMEPGFEAQLDPEEIQFRLRKPPIAERLEMVAMKMEGCNVEIYEQLGYPKLEKKKTTLEFNKELNENVFTARVVPHTTGGETQLLSLHEYKLLLDEEQAKGASICGDVKPIDDRCKDKPGKKEGKCAQYKFFTVPQMMLPIYFNPHTIKEYPGILLWHAVGAGKTCTALKIFNNFRCKPYKKIWITNDELATNLISGSMGKSDLCNCWKGNQKSNEVFLGKEHKNTFKAEDDEILVLTYKNFAELLYRGTSQEGRLYRSSYAPFWTKKGDREPLDPKTYRYSIKGGGERTAAWKRKEGTDDDFDPLENTVIVIDEAHKLAELRGIDTKIILNAVNDSKKNPNGAKLVLMTATPITDDPMTAVKLLNLLVPSKYGITHKVKGKGGVEEVRNGFPQSIDAFKDAYWSDVESKQSFINSIKGLISYYDPSTNPTAFAQKTPGRLAAKVGNVGYSKNTADKLGVLQIQLSQSDQNAVKKHCNYREDLGAIENLNEPMDILNALKGEERKQLHKAFGIPASRSKEDFLQEAFYDKDIRDKKKISDELKSVIRARPLECIQDAVTSGNTAEWQKKTKAVKNLSSTKAKVLSAQIRQLDADDRAAGGLNKHMIYSSIQINKSDNPRIKGRYTSVPNRLFQKLLSDKDLKLKKVETEDDLKGLIRDSGLKLTPKGLCPISGKGNVKIPAGDRIYFLANTKGTAASDDEKRLKKLVEEIFNDHIYNNRGQLIRFIVLDTGYKEGLSLYNIKHIHIMEPQMSRGDLTQAVGRAIRRCGHVGIPYKKGVGWEVFVYLYDALFRTGGEGTPNLSLGNKIVEILGKDVSFKNELNQALMTSAIDYSMNIDADRLAALAIEPQAKLLGSLWERPPEDFDYVEDLYFYKLYPKINRIVPSIIGFVQEYAKERRYMEDKDKWWWQKKGKLAQEDVVNDWFLDRYVFKFFEKSVFLEETKKEFNRKYSRKMPQDLKKLFRYFNYHKDIVFNFGNTLVLPVFTFKERSKIKYPSKNAVTLEEQLEGTEDVHAMLIMKLNKQRTEGKLKVYFKDKISGKVCPTGEKTIIFDLETGPCLRGEGYTGGQNYPSCPLYNLSLWLRIPEENINFGEDIRDLIGDCKPVTQPYQPPKKKPQAQEEEEDDDIRRKQAAVILEEDIEILPEEEEELEAELEGLIEEQDLEEELEGLIEEQALEEELVEPTPSPKEEKPKKIWIYWSEDDTDAPGWYEAKLREDGEYIFTTNWLPLDANAPETGSPDKGMEHAQDEFPLDLVNSVADARKSGDYVIKI
jgi:hypothetical protein